MFILESLTFPHSTLDIVSFIHYSMLLSPMTVLAVKSFPWLCPALWVCLLPSYLDALQATHPCQPLSRPPDCSPLSVCVGDSLSCQLHWTHSHASGKALRSHLTDIFILYSSSHAPHSVHLGSCISPWIWSNNFIGPAPQSWPTPSQASLYLHTHFFLCTIKILLCHIGVLTWTGHKVQAVTWILAPPEGSPPPRIWVQYDTAPLWMPLTWLWSHCCYH